MKKWFILLTTLILSIGLLFTGCGGNQSHHGSDKGKKIIIGLDDNYPPIGFRDSAGKLIGSDIELATEAAKRLGVEVEFKPIDWSAKEAALKSGKIDAIWNGLTPTPEREKNILFTKPYQKASQVIVVAPESSIKMKGDLAGKVVGIQEGSTAQDVLNKETLLLQSFKQLKKYGDMVSVFMDLQAGRIDVAVVDEILARYYIQKENATFIILPESFGEEVDAVGVALENKVLQEQLNKALDEMYQDGTTKKILEKWFGYDLTIKP